MTVTVRKSLFVILLVLITGCSKDEAVNAPIRSKSKDLPGPSQKLALPLTGRLAFHSYTAYDLDDSGKRWLDGRIHICDFPAKTAVTIAEIEKHTIHAMNPIFNRDGTQITFMALPIGPKYGADWPKGLDLFVYDFRNGELANISKQAGLESSIDEDPFFTPDGNSLLFKRNREDLWIVDLKTLQTKPITTDRKQNEESGPRVSRDGQWVYYWNGDGETADIHRLSLNGGASKVVAGLPNIQEMFPVLLGNGRLAYTRWTSPTQHDDEIYLLDLKSGKHQKAAFNSTNGADDSDPFAINHWIGFSSRRKENGKGGWDLYLGDPNSPTPVHLRKLSTPRHDLGGTYTPTVVGNLN